MEVITNASAGTMESSDVYVEVEPASELHIALESVVQAQFGENICNVVHQVLQDMGVEKANVRVIDRGALECVIRARVETAILRGKGEA